ncbi:AraC family transcriptional regulator [Kaarinaea lacus]
MHATTLSSVALMFWKTLEQDYQLNSESLFRDAGLDHSKIYDPNYRYPDAGMFKLWRLALQQTNDECLGLKVAQHIQATTLHALGFAWLSSSTLKDALERLVRYYRLVTDVEKLSLTEGDKHYSLQLARKSPDIEYIDQDYDAFFAAITIMCRALHGDSFSPAMIKMERSEPGCLEEMNSFFNTEMQFEAGENSIQFDKASLLRTLPSGNAELARENDQIISRYLSKLDREDTVLQIKAKLLERLPSGNVNEEEVAKSLNMSIRTMQRKLKTLDQSYKQIVDITRRELALEYVREGNVPITTITFMLGFSDPANFTRAFRRWTGQSPSDYRKIH